MSSDLRGGSESAAPIWNGELEALVDEFINRRNAGDAPDVDSLIARCPEHRDKLKRLLATAQLVAGLKTDPTGGTDTARDGATDLAFHDLGDFQLIREIGRGGMGIVYEAEQRSLGRHVAVKVLPAAALFDSRQLQRFQKEIDAAVTVHHPNIVAVHSAGVERGAHFFAMQLIEGQSLSQTLLEWRDLSPYDDQVRNVARFRQVASWCYQAAMAIEHVHRMGIIHRDIKPSNLLVNRAGHLWVSDFGLAMTAEDGDLTLPGDIPGTFRYMSPEQLRGERRHLDHRTDVYSLGVTLYELLTLRPAFPGNDRVQLSREIVERGPRAPREINRSIPPALERIVLHAIARAPEQRFQTAGELAEDIQRYMEGKPVRAPHSRRTHPASVWRRKGVLTAVALLVALAISVILVSSRRNPQWAVANAPAGAALMTWPADARVILVKTHADDGEGSLRWAIGEANASSGRDVVRFALTGESRTITLETALPSLVDRGTFIDGAATPGFDRPREIEIDASRLPEGTPALTLEGGSSRVSGLTINRSNGPGILLTAGADDNLIDSNFIGTDPSGSRKAGNSSSGLVLESSRNTIRENLVSGNWESGICVRFATARRNLIEKNRIGTTADGAASLGNLQSGIVVHAGAVESLIRGNVISANGASGIALEDVFETVIESNRIGTDLEGHASIGNGWSGIVVGRSSRNRIGTASASRAEAGAGNIISGNGHWGVALEDSASDLHRITGNVIGLLADGKSIAANGWGGMVIRSPTNLVEENVVSGNQGPGIQVMGSSNRIINNRIGTDASSGAARGNREDGLKIHSSDNRIVGNVISANGSNGVWIGEEDSDSNLLLSNHIGVDLEGTAALGNSGWGVFVTKGDGNSIGQPSGNSADCNVIGGNQHGGATILGLQTDANSIRNNCIGTDRSGRLDLRNAATAIFVGEGTAFGVPGAPTNTILGASSSPRERNVVRDKIGKRSAFPPPD